MLYGPKTDQGWGSGLALGNGNSSSLKGNYVLSRDGKTIFQWFNKETTQIDMQSDPELKEVTIIGKRAFYKGSLTSIILPDNLERIGNDAFMYNELTNITIPNSVITIGAGAFYGNQLSSITIPNSVTTIGFGAFGINPLMNVTINAVTPPTISGDIFPRSPNLKIYVPTGSLAAYKTTEGWKEYASQIYAQ